MVFIISILLFFFSGTTGLLANGGSDSYLFEIHLLLRVLYYNLSVLADVRPALLSLYIMHLFNVITLLFSYKYVSSYVWETGRFCIGKEFVLPIIIFSRSEYG